MNSILAWGFGGPEVLLLGAMVFFAVPFAAFWLWMLIDCLTKEDDQSQKLIWLLVIIFTSFVGAPLYFFLRRLPRERAKPLRIR